MHRNGVLWVGRDLKTHRIPPCHGLGPLPDTKLAEGTSRSVAAGGRDTSAPLQSLHPFFSLALLTLPWWPPVFLPAPQENRILLDTDLPAEAFSMPRGQTTPGKHLPEDAELPFPPLEAWIGFGLGFLWVREKGRWHHLHPGSWEHQGFAQGPAASPELPAPI